MACIICSPVSITRASPASTGWPGTPSSCPASSWRTTPGIRMCCSRISSHYRTGAPLPAQTQDRLRATRSFHAGLQMVRQLEFALFDFRLHAEYSPERGARLREVLHEARRRVAVVPAPEWNRFANSFGHIFAGGYAAGYYSYKWAEVLAADAFSAFEERGVFDRATAQRFLDCHPVTGGQPGCPGSLCRVPGAPPRYPAPPGPARHSRAWLKRWIRVEQKIVVFCSTPATCGGGAHPVPGPQVLGAPRW